MITERIELPTGVGFSTRASRDILQFLESTVWGSQGLQYRVPDYEPMLARLPDPMFYTLREESRLIGNVMFFLKTVSVGSRPVRVAYLTQLSVHPDSRGRGLAGRLVEAVLRHVEVTVPGTEPAGVIAYVEEANAPSLSVFRKQGFKDIGGFHGTVIHRFSPRPFELAGLLEPKEADGLVRDLRMTYGDHSLMDFETSLHPADYRVLRGVNGTVMAGLQTHVEQWQVTQMDGISGWLTLKGLARSRWLQRHLFNPAACRFLHLGNLFARAGYEAWLYRLIENELAREEVPFAVGYFDKRSPFFQRFAEAGSFGILNAVMETPVRVLAWFRNLPPDLASGLTRRPLVISPLDIT